LCFCSHLLHWNRQEVATKTQSTVKLAELTLAPWARQLQSKIITFVAARPKEPRQIKLLSLSIVFLQQSFALIQSKSCHKNTIDSDIGWTCLGSLGRATTKQNNYICCCTAQGDKAITATVPVNCTFVATFCIGSCKPCWKNNQQWCWLNLPCLLEHSNNKGNQIYLLLHSPISQCKFRPHHCQLHFCSNFLPV